MSIHLQLYQKSKMQTLLDPCIRHIFCSAKYFRHLIHWIAIWLAKLPSIGLHSVAIEIRVLSYCYECHSGLF